MQAGAAAAEDQIKVEICSSILLANMQLAYVMMQLPQCFHSDHSPSLLQIRLQDSVQPAAIAAER